MFTGLIQNVCSVKGLSRVGSTATLTVDLGSLADQTKIGLPRLASIDAKAGDSVAINGACLTVAKQAGPLVTFDLSGETLAKTTLGKLTPGSKVNVELAMRADDRFGGHFVLGHIDGIATIRQIEKQDDFATFTFAAPKDLLALMIPKGSVAVDGISLTIAELKPDSFTAAVIPQTLLKTNLGFAKITAQVNLETDIITRTVVRQLESMGLAKGKLTVDKLQQLGF
jgi:riboflavin synthase